MFYVMICRYIKNGAAGEDRPKIIRDRLANRDLRNHLLHARISRFLQLSRQKKTVQFTCKCVLSSVRNVTGARVFRYESKS